MKIIKNNYNKTHSVFNAKHTSHSWRRFCDNCNSEFLVDEEDTYIGALGCRYVRCPCCGWEDNVLDDGITLTSENLSFPTHYFSFKDGVKLTNKVVDEYVKECIEALRNSTNKNFYATHTGTGDTHVFVFKYDGDEEYYVYVGKGGYETQVPFEEVDYK